MQAEQYAELHPCSQFSPVHVANIELRCLIPTGASLASAHFAALIDLLVGNETTSSVASYNRLVYDTGRVYGWV